MRNILIDHRIEHQGETHTFRIMVHIGPETCIAWAEKFPDKVYTGHLTVEMLDAVRAVCAASLHDTGKAGMTTTEEYRGSPENVVGNPVQRNPDYDPQ